MYLLKIKVFFDISISIGLIISLILFNLLFFHLINILFSKNNILFVYIFINLNILFIMIINKYKLYVNKIIFKFSQWYLW